MVLRDSMAQQSLSGNLKRTYSDLEAHQYVWLYDGIHVML